MKGGLALLGAATLALAGGLTVAASGRAPPVAAVNDAAVTGGTMALRLSDYGFFANGAVQQPAARVVPYRLNTPLYSDGAEKLRFVYLPQGTQLTADGDGLLQFPVGSALIKTFAFGEGDARRLIETRVMLHREDGWVALPYRWDAAQSDAVLAVGGGRVPVTTPEGEAISYQIPNKNQCKECHSLDGAVVPIGPKARNMSTLWLDAMNLTSGGSGTIPQWEARDSVRVDQAARAYLDVNCAHCHQPGGAASNSGLDLRWEQHDPVKLGIMKRPVAAGRGAGDLLFDIVPGKPEESILVHRMGHLDPGVAMPELGKSTVDREGLDVVRRWITQMGEGQGASPTLKDGG